MSKIYVPPVPGGETQSQNTGITSFKTVPRSQISVREAGLKFEATLEYLSMTRYASEFNQYILLRIHRLPPKYWQNLKFESIHVCVKLLKGSISTYDNISIFLIRRPHYLTSS